MPEEGFIGYDFPGTDSEGLGAESPRAPSGTSPYQLAHAPLGCQAICTPVMDAHFTGSTAQSVLRMCSCQAHSSLWLGTACPFLWSGLKSLKETDTSKQLILL